jgi:hypothetical protein
MKTKAAILWGLNQPWEIEEVELDGPARKSRTIYGPTVSRRSISPMPPKTTRLSAWARCTA